MPSEVQVRVVKFHKKTSETETAIPDHRKSQTLHVHRKNDTEDPVQPNEESARGKPDATKRGNSLEKRVA